MPSKELAKDNFKDTSSDLEDSLAEVEKNFWVELGFIKWLATLAHLM